MVSESTADKDENLKKFLYEREGVEFQVLVHPNLKKTRISRLEGREFIKVF